MRGDEAYVRSTPTLNTILLNTHVRRYVYAHMYDCCKSTYMHTYIHVHAYIYTCALYNNRTYVHTCVRTQMRVYMHTYIHTYIHMYICTCICTYAHVYMYTCTCMYICKCTYVLLQQSPFKNLSSVALNLLGFLAGLLHVVAENVVTDRQTHRPSTVTLAVHARQGVIINPQQSAQCFTKVMP